ncbi:hypothetical protein ILUMI_15013 [Ignelater luminosus]|uniref:Uncharacterized protein n=1 Tax=Ignelater luminosus TaxID=2038154 RepID=A0A8K0CXF9_IGNLU|nr:hypothetical protein ILUMI_15013 [Ignelater luminosus]
MSETDYSDENDFDIVLPPEEATAAHHVTAENLQEDVPVKHTIVLEKKEKVKKKIFELKEKTSRKKRRESETWKRNKAVIAREKRNLSKEKTSDLKDQLKFVKEEYRWYYEEIFAKSEEPDKKKRRTN